MCAHQAGDAMSGRPIHGSGRGGWGLGRWVAALVMLAAVPDLAAAQVTPTAREFGRGTTISLVPGVASASSETGLVLGGAVGWELNPWAEIETDMTWMARRHGAAAFAAAITGQANLTARRAVVPFLRAGVGLYSASFDTAQAIPPDFYARRLGPGGLHQGPNYRFTDPSVVAGGGVTLFVNRHVSVRPEVQSTIARRASRNYVVTTLTVQLTYHFEEHHVTPTTRVP